MYQPLIWKTHKRREEYTVCPHCGKPLRWIYDGYEWIPVDREPVMFIHHPDGKNNVVYNRKIYENCLLYKKGDVRFDNVCPLTGNVQHYYTCDVLREHRRNYMRAGGR